MRYSEVLTRRRFVLQAGFDAAAWFVALFISALLRYEFQFSHIKLGGLIAVATTAAVLQVIYGVQRGLYVHRWRYGTLEEGMNCVITVTVTTAVIAVANRFLLGHRLPVSATIGAAMAAIVVMGSGRFVFRFILERSQRPASADVEPIMVFGAGDAATKVVRSMLGTPTSPYVPVALLDDNLSLSNLRIKSVPVMGTRLDIDHLSKTLGVRTMLLAVPSANGEDVRDIVARADAAGLRTVILPSVSELYGAAPGVGDIRPLTEADLLGRRELQTDIGAVAGYLTGKRVLVTGAGGSIGSELCRHIHRFAPAELIMLDRDESALQAVQLSIEGRGLLDDPHLVIADIRDEDRILEVFGQFKPEVVFHAAALKHLPLLEMHPAEGIKTNVWGTQTMLKVSQRFGVSTFVNVSTDKAADPSSVLGATKRVAEQLTAHAAADAVGTYLSVRFGNVIGSRGSVLPLFRAQVEAGGPVTVTHPDVTRYFMTIPEACELVIQAGAIGWSGEVMVLNMGEPVRIADLAQRLIVESGKNIEIVYTGLRHGEKLHEVLFGDAEVAARSAHPLINAVQVDAIAPRDVEMRLAELGMSVDLRSSTKTVVLPALDDQQRIDVDLTSDVDVSTD
jgi:FlaA1/EpsC-like NDP-sugar epimerase